MAQSMYNLGKGPNVENLLGYMTIADNDEGVSTAGNLAQVNQQTKNVIPCAGTCSLYRVSFRRLMLLCAVPKMEPCGGGAGGATTKAPCGTHAGRYAREETGNVRPGSARVGRIERMVPADLVGSG
ncbi:uncharacterized protein PpBr36_11084 [Pyricularia pennisetigena]|uniref:uncharacterized protein n=1 Tax=Pyricularia pennisetigena TaxID=1578925 RepID=UPI00114FD892|nr:uncharacterized protein PpBr36_11084 [Pyricularia pennisetigena]TLS20640.1 hypothetical protein PpBr36_11084 [Pyricularia pennisetigena]